MPAALLWFLAGLLGAALLALLLAGARERRRLAALEERLAPLAGSSRAAGMSGTAGVRPAFERLLRLADRAAAAQAALESDLRQQRFDLQAMLTSMVEGVVVTDAQQVIRLVNPSFRAMFSIEGDPAGQTLLRVTRHGELNEAIRAAAVGPAAETREIQVAPPGAVVAERVLSVNAVPMRDAAGAVTSVVAVLHDVSRVRQLEEVRRQFVANVSHELRTPLSIFQGYLETLLDDGDLPRAQVAQYLRIMSKHSDRLRALLDDLLTLARLEARSDALDWQPLDLGRFLEEILAEWAPRLAERKTVLEIAPETGEMPADAMRLEQVIGNLLENAIKYSAPGAEIAVRARRLETAAGARIELRVSDSGSGIPPADLPRIFERFYRVEKARSRDAGGTGLGLSIVKHIVGLHGGEVRAESVYGQGTAIVLEFPAEFPADPPADLSAEAAADFPLPGEPGRE